MEPDSRFRRIWPAMKAFWKPTAGNGAKDGPAYLGEFEQVVLLAVLRLDDRAYAIPVREEIEERTGRAVARGALYTALERLESKGLLRSRMSGPLPERGGRSRRYFSVTSTGLAAVRASRASLLRLWQGLERQLEP